MSAHMYRILANVVFVIHILVIVFMITNAALTITGFMADHPLYHRLSTVFVGMVIISQIVFLGCPLVALEYSLRRHYDPSIHYTGSFTVYLIEKLTGVTIPTLAVTIATYLIVAIVIAGWIFLKR